MAEAVIAGTDQGKAIANAVGINKQNVNNAKQIIKDYFKKTSMELIDARVGDLQKSINDKSSALKAADDYLKDYNKSGKMYKLFHYFEKNAVEDSKEIAEKTIKESTDEIKVLKDAKQKL